MEQIKTKTIIETIVDSNMTPINTPTLYCPTLDANNKYIDVLPHSFKSGVSCPCSEIGNKVIYHVRSAFLTHIKTNKHSKWMSDNNVTKDIKKLENKNALLTALNQKQRQKIAVLEQTVVNCKNTIDVHQATIDLLSKQMAEISQMTNNHYSELSNLHHHLTTPLISNADI
jgi:hypothetical protein